MIEHQPVRRLRNSGSAITGYFASQKLNRLVQYESSLERDYIFLLEYDKDVFEFTEQPLTIKYLIGEEKHQYTPDFFVRHSPQSSNSQPRLIEIKYEVDLEKNREALEPKFEAGKLYAAEKHYLFEVLTEKVIRTQYLANVKLLLPFRRLTTNSKVKSEILNSFENTPKQSITQILSKRNGRALEAKYLWHLIANHHLQVEMDQKITLDSFVTKTANTD